MNNRLTNEKSLQLLQELSQTIELSSEQLIYNKLGQLERIEKELGTGLMTLFKALKEGFWIKVSCLNLSPEELERFKYKNSKYYDKKYDLIFCPGANANTENIFHIHASLGITFLDNRIVYFLSMPFGYVLVEDCGITWSLNREEWKKWDILN